MRQLSYHQIITKHFGIENAEFTRFIVLIQYVTHNNLKSTGLNLSELK